MAASLLRRGAAAAGRRWCPVDVLRRLVSSEAAPERAASRAPPEMPPFDHQPRPYAGMGGAEIFEKRKAVLGPSLFHYYQKPVKAPSVMFDRVCFGACSSSSKLLFSSCDEINVPRSWELR